MSEAVEVPAVEESIEAYFSRANDAEKAGTLHALSDAPAAEPVADELPAEAEVKADDATPVEPVKTKNPRKDPEARIAQIRAEKGEIERKAQEAEARAARLEAELQAAKAPKAPVLPVTPHAAFPDFATWSARAGNEQKQYEDYIDARADYRYEQRQRADQTIQSERQIAQSIAASSAAFSERLTAQIADEPGFLDTLDQGLLEATRIGAYAQKPDGSFYDRTTGETLPPPTFRNFLMEQVFKSDQPKALLRHLSDLAPQERQRLATLPPDEVIRYLAKHDAPVTPAAASRGSAQTVRKSQAPDPITPLGSSPNVTADEPGDDEPIEMHIRRENSRDRKAGRL